MTGIITRSLQEHFANPENLEFNKLVGVDTSARQLEELKWDPDFEKTKIQIDPVWKYNAQDIQRRPALYIKRNVTKPGDRLGIDDGFTVNSNRNANGSVDQVRGEYHSKLLLGSHTVFAVGTTAMEAEILAQEVFNHFMMMGPLLRRDLKLTRMSVEELGEVAVLDEFVEHFVVPVVVAYAHTATWRIYQIAPWLKSLTIAVTAK